LHILVCAWVRFANFLGEEPARSPPHATGGKRATAPRAPRGEIFSAHLAP
jgi:hypothetical protein